MMVDGLTYLLNSCAERVKNRPFSDAELALPVNLRDHRRELHRLYLELFPPAFSLVVLMSITVLTMKEASATLRDGPDQQGEETSIHAMLIFSGANLALDIINVTCFARAGAAYGLSVLKNDQLVRESLRALRKPSEAECENDESSSLISSAVESNTETNRDGAVRSLMVNLNMCSAWTVSSNR